jgi:hypothetical protein
VVSLMGLRVIELIRDVLSARKLCIDVDFIDLLSSIAFLIVYIYSMYKLVAHKVHIE